MAFLNFGLRDSVNLSSLGFSGNELQSATVLGQDCDKKGYLTKQGGVVKSWRRRYCILKGNRLYYFKDRNDTSPQGVIMLDEAQVATAGPVTKKPNSFEIRAQNRVYYMFTDTTKQREEWMTAILRAASLNRQRQQNAAKASPSLTSPLPSPRGSIAQPLSSVVTTSSDPGSNKMQQQQQQQRIVDNAYEKEEQTIPLFVERVVTWLGPSKTNGLKEWGIFRRPGLSYEVQHMRNCLDNGDVDLPIIYSPHSVATLFKMYLKELPEPVITFALYHRYVDTHAIDTEEDPREQDKKRAQQLLEVANELPRPNRDLLKYIAKFLASVAIHSDTNGMDAHSLAVVFGPLLAPSIDLPQNYTTLIKNCYFYIQHWNRI
ncbi:Rho GTPase-activating protein 25 [Balamuthia mandrillaris]